MPLVIGISASGRDSDRIDPTGGSDRVLDAFVARAWGRAIDAHPQLPPGLYASVVAFEYRVVGSEIVALHATVVEGSRNTDVDRALLQALREHQAWFEEGPPFGGGGRALRSDLVLEVPEPACAATRPDVAAAFVRAVHALDLREGTLPAGRHRVVLQVASVGRRWSVQVSEGGPRAVRALLAGLERRDLLVEAPAHLPHTAVTLVLKG